MPRGLLRWARRVAAGLLLLALPVCAAHAQVPARIPWVVEDLIRGGCTTTTQLMRLTRELETAKVIADTDPIVLQALRSATLGQTEHTKWLLKTSDLEIPADISRAIEETAEHVSRTSPAADLVPRSYAELDVYGEFKTYPMSRVRYYRLRDAQLVWVDYPGMRTDYPQLASFTDAQIDEWILANFARVSEYQLRLQGIRTTEIPVYEDDVVEWVVPMHYNRAALAEAKIDGETIGLIDLKGPGHTRANDVQEQVTAFQEGDDAAKHAVQTEHHNNGVVTIGEGIAETTRELATRYAGYIHSAQTGERVHTAQSRFLIMTPYRVLGDGGGRHGAIYGRRPVWRTNNAMVDDHLGFPFPTVNSSTKGTQHGLFDEIVDFGDVKVEWPSVQNQFGMFDPGHNWSARDSKGWKWAHETGDAVENALVTGSEDGRAIFSRHLDDMVGPVRWEWEQMQHGGAQIPQHNSLDALLSSATPRGSGWALDRPSRQAARRDILSRYIVPRLVTTEGVDAVAESIARTGATWVFDGLEKAAGEQATQRLLQRYQELTGP